MEDSEFVDVAIPAIKAGKSADEIAKLTKMEDGKKVSARLTKLRRVLKPYDVEIPSLAKGRRPNGEQTKALADRIRELLKKSE